MNRRRVGRREKREWVNEAAVGDKRTTLMAAAAARGEKGRWARGGEVGARLVGNATRRMESERE